MTDIITRIESADGPDRELDAAIARSIGWGCVIRDPEAQNKYVCWRKHYRCGEWIMLPRYTASIDAALTLVPEGWSVHLHTSEDRPDCEIHITVKLGQSYPTNKTIYGERSGVGSFGMVALALAAAALKARGA